MSVQRSRFLRIKEDLTVELRSCLHLVGSIHDAGFKLTLGKVCREFDDYNTVYFLDPETDMDFDHSQAFY